MRKDWQRTIKVIPSGVQTYSKQPSMYVDGVYPKYSGGKYIDYTCALGVGLYDNVSSLPHWEETILAEKLIELIPSAEMVRFFKTGSEANSAGVKVARFLTKKKGIAYSGYHGWHDWGNMYKFELNNLKSLEILFKTRKIGVVILEPYIYDPPLFLNKIIDYIICFVVIYLV